MLEFVFGATGSKPACYSHFYHSFQSFYDTARDGFSPPFYSYAPFLVVSFLLDSVLLHSQASGGCRLSADPVSNVAH